MNTQNPVKLTARSLVFATIWFALGAALLETFAQTVLPATGFFGFRQHLSSPEFRILTGILVADLAVMALVAGAIWVMSRFRPAWFGVEALSGVLALACFYAAIKPLSIFSANAVRMLTLGLATVVYRAVRKNPARWIQRFRRGSVWLGVGTGAVLFSAYFGMGIAERIHYARTPSPPTGSPNILFVVLDTFRADRTGMYGYNRGTTPFLDELAGHSIQFDKAFSTSSWTLPAHVSAFTGRRPGEHGAEIFAYDGRFETIAQALTRRGYATVGVSANRAYTTYSRGVGLGFLHYENAYTDWRDALDVATLAASSQRLLDRLGIRITLGAPLMRAEEVNRRFLNWVDHRPDRPFFAFLNYMETHFPRQPPAQLASRFPGLAEPISREKWEHLVASGETPSAQLERAIQDNYDGAVAYLDSQLRLLFDEVKRRGLEKNLLIIIVGDHGESLGEHALYDHRNSLYLEQVRIPLLMRFPGKLPQGVHRTEPVSLRQVAATIAAYSGLPDGTFPGPPLPANEPDEKAPREPIEQTAELAGGQFAGFHSRLPAYQGWIRSVFSGNLHFILQEHGKMELFDWVHDPSEMNNIVNSADTEMVERFKEKLLRLTPEPAGHQR